MTSASMAYVSQHVMNRRKDHKTAELVDIALLTRAAFGPRLARRFVQLRSASPELMRDVLARPREQLRHQVTIVSLNCEGRRRHKRD